MCMRLLITTFVLGLLLCGAACAQQQIPAESLTKLQNVFGDVRDQLWTTNDGFWHHGEFNRCIATMRLITSMDPYDTEAYEDAAWLMDSDLREEDAEAFLREGLANNPDVYDLYFELGSFCYFRKRFDEAVSLYSACMTFADAPAYYRHQLAHAYELAGATGDALETWLEAEAIDPQSPVPPMQIERIMEGGEPSQVPEMISRSIQTRKEERSKGQNVIKPKG
jgi:tetratricopeptide (TPR) repeat protein